MLSLQVSAKQSKTDLHVADDLLLKETTDVGVDVMQDTGKGV